MVASGTRLQFFIQGNISIAMFGEANAATVRATVIDVLSKAPAYFTVEDLPITATGVLDAALHGEFFSAPFSATITLVTYGDYATIGDVGQIVSNAFYQATGNLPTVSTSSQAPAVQSTGATLGGVVNSITSTITTQEILIIGGILVLAWIVASGPNVGKLARAVR